MFKVTPSLLKLMWCHLHKGARTSCIQNPNRNCVCFLSHSICGWHCNAWV